MHRQITLDERYMIGKYRREQISIREIAFRLERSPSTISRELKRNKRNSGFWGALRAQEKTNARRSKSRKKSHFSAETWAFVVEKIREEVSPEQISLWLKDNGKPSISHKTIYRHIKKERKRGGTLYVPLRQAQKGRRKGYRTKDSRGKLLGKRPLAERPEKAKERSEYGHFEIDVVLGKKSKHCALTLVDRMTRFDHWFENSTTKPWRRLTAS